VATNSGATDDAIDDAIDEDDGHAARRPQLQLTAT
jgi:hypothetical protein